MPWDCKECQLHVENDGVPECPGCGATKSAWSMVVDQTRVFTVAAAKVLYLRGTGSDPLPSEGPGHEGVETVEATEALAVPKRVVSQLAADGVLPAPEQVLFVRMFPPSPNEDLTVRLKPVFESREPEEHEFAPDGSLPGEAGFVERRFLFVFGDGETPEIPEEWELDVVDVTDKTPAGHAPEVHARALTRRKRKLPIRAAARLRFFLSL